MHMSGCLDLDPMMGGPGRQYVTSTPQLLHATVFGASMSLPDRIRPFTRSCIATLVMCNCSAWAPAMIFVAMALTMVVLDSAVPPLPMRWGAAVSVAEACSGAVPSGHCLASLVLSASFSAGAKRQEFHLATTAGSMPMAIARAALCSSLRRGRSQSTSAVMFIGFHVPWGGWSRSPALICTPPGPCHVGDRRWRPVGWGGVTAACTHARCDIWASVTGGIIPGDPSAACTGK